MDVTISQRIFLPSSVLYQFKYLWHAPFIETLLKPIRVPSCRVQAAGKKVACFHNPDNPHCRRPDTCHCGVEQPDQSGADRSFVPIKEEEDLSRPNVFS